MKYTPPKTKDGNVQHVPVVFKNRDSLVSAIKTFRDLAESIAGMIDLDDEDVLMQISPDFDSSRFNNYIGDGMNSAKMTDKEIEEYLRNESVSICDREEGHPENKTNILGDTGYFYVECNCGNFVNFNSPKEIPEESLKCELCDRTLIQYIHVDDEDIEFDEGTE